MTPSDVCIGRTATLSNGPLSVLSGPRSKRPVVFFIRKYSRSVNPDAFTLAGSGGSMWWQMVQLTPSRARLPYLWYS